MGVVFCAIFSTNRAILPEWLEDLIPHIFLFYHYFQINFMFFPTLEK